MNNNVTGIRCTKNQKKELKELMEKYNMVGDDIIKLMVNIMATSDIDKNIKPKVCDVTFTCRSKEKYVFQLLYKVFKEKHNINGSVLVEMLLDYIR